MYTLDLIILNFIHEHKYHYWGDSGSRDWCGGGILFGICTRLEECRLRWSKKEAAKTAVNPYANVETNPLKDVKTNPYEGVKLNPFK